MSSSVIKVVVFDLDDTLADTSSIFFQLRSAFTALMAAQSFEASAAREEYEQIEDINLNLFGYISERNLVSMREAYERLAQARGKSFSASVLRQIGQIGIHCLYRVPPLFPSSLSLLDWCGSRYKLALLTRGSIALQNAKIETLGIRKYFEVIDIVDEKTEASFASALASLDCHPRNAISVGDSLRFDVLPACQLGMKAVHVPYVHASIQWQHDFLISPSALAGYEYRIATDLKAVESVLQKIDSP